MRRRGLARAHVVTKFRLSCSERGVHRLSCRRTGGAGRRNLCALLLYGRGIRGEHLIPKVSSRSFLHIIRKRGAIPVAGRRIHTLSLYGLNLARSTIMCSIKDNAKSVTIRYTGYDPKVHICTVRRGTATRRLLHQGLRGFRLTGIVPISKGTPRVLRPLRPPARMFVKKDDKHLTSVLRIV